MYKLIYNCGTNVGKLRSQNQDNYVCGTTHMISEATTQHDSGLLDNVDKPFLLAIYDGMGGEQHGEAAARIASEYAAGFDFSGDTDSSLRRFIKKANLNICAFAAQNNISSTGTTAAMLLFDKDRVTVCNIGDSPVFRFSSGALTQLSEDHVGVALPGRKPPLSQCLGIPEDELTISPYISSAAYKSGDRFLICSDGLTDMVSKQRICEILSAEPIETVVDALINEALANGGRDNITVIVADLTAVESESSDVKRKGNGSGLIVLGIILLACSIICFWFAAKQSGIFNKKPQITNSSTAEPSVSPKLHPKLDLFGI